MPAPIPTEPILLTILRCDVVEAAKRLLGSHLVRGELRAEIVETEAYRAEDDPACHAFRGSTARTQVMFEDPGRAYVYFCYGCHWMLNVTAHEHGRAAAVLIRAARPVGGVEIMRSRRQRNDRSPKDESLLSGPGKLAQAFAISGDLNGKDLFNPQSTLRIEAGARPLSYIATPRVGIATGKAEGYLWRFVARDLVQWASTPRPTI
jgi:DNA-3-methyladenine glycosylase